MKEIIRKSTLFVAGLFFCNLMILAQEQKQIHGSVLNASGDPVQGVSISIEGSDSPPAISGENGEFSLKTDESGVWIIIAPLDEYKSKRIFLPSHNYKNVKVHLTRIGLPSGYDDVLMVGGEEKRRNQLNPIYDLPTEEFNTLPYSSLLQYFQGNVPGAYFVNHSGMPGSSGALYLRGLRSINSHNMPLILVDGMPLEDGSLYGSEVNGYSYSPLSIIEQQDVSNISIINGGTGATLFGAKGANGIIMIETLKPTETNTSINFSFKTGMHFKPDQLPQLNTREYKTLANDILSSSNIHNELFKDLYPGLYITPDEDDYIRYSHDFNWQDEIFTNSVFSDAYLSVQGGDAIGKYGLSIGYLNHKGIYHHTGFNRFTARFVGTFNVFEWLRMYVSANLATADSEIKESALTPQVNPILTSLFKTPMMFPYQYDDNNQQMSVLDNVDELGVSNPTAVMNSFNAENSNNRFLTAIRLEGDITSSLTFNSLMGLNINSLRQTAFYPNQGMEYYGQGEVFNISNSMTNNLFSIYNNNYLNFRKLFGNHHHLNAMIGMKWYTNNFEEDLGITKNLNENDEYRFLQSGTAFLREIGGA
ncbi:MAG: TonB-dependent receptor plug domain-containing protein, partial [bacterium]